MFRALPSARWTMLLQNASLTFELCADSMEVQQEFLLASMSVLDEVRVRSTAFAARCHDVQALPLIVVRAIVAAVTAVTSSA